MRYVSFFRNRQGINIAADSNNRMFSCSDLCNDARLQRQIQNMKPAFL